MLDLHKLRAAGNQYTRINTQYNAGSPRKKSAAAGLRRRPGSIVSATRRDYETYPSKSVIWTEAAATGRAQSAPAQAPGVPP